MEWISVNKRLPPRGVRVLLWQESGANCYGHLSGVSTSDSKGNIDLRPTYIRNKILHWSLGNDTPFDYDGKPNVTHWMEVHPPNK